MQVTYLKWILEIMHMGLVVFVCFAPYKWQMRKFEKKYPIRSIFIGKLKLTCVLIILVGIISTLLCIWVGREFDLQRGIKTFLPMTLAYWVFCARMCVILWEKLHESPEKALKKTTHYQIF